MSENEKIQARQLRLECLKLANVNREGHSAKDIVAVATELFAFVEGDK